MRGNRHGAGFYSIAADPGCGRDEKPLRLISYSGTGPDPTRVISLEADQTGIFLFGFLEQFCEEASQEGVKVYCRAAPRRQIEDQFPAETLRCLATHLRAANETPRRRRSRGRIPAAYTYLGQFIAHEISDLAVLNESGRAGPIRSARFDLDSLIGARQEDPLETQRQVWTCGVGVGTARDESGKQQFVDLPRRSDGMALIADPRNDSNLALAQMHVLLSNFHLRLAPHGVPCDAPEVAEAERRTRRHVQSVVLHDYLARVIDPEVYQDVLCHGRRVIYPGALNGADPVLVPIEFAAACFRVGHSMVRNSYEKWEFKERPAKLRALLKFTGEGGSFGGLRRLSEEWQINWASMIEDADDGDLNLAEDVDQFLAKHMHSLPMHIFSASLPEGRPTGTIDIAEATLSRQRNLELPVGQDAVCFLNDGLPASQKITPLTPEGLLHALTDGVANPNDLRAFVENNGLHVETPLWLYCLLETRCQQHPGRFGPLTSRIVMETVHATIEAAPDGIICQGKTVNFTAAESLSQRDEYHFRDLVSFAS